MNNSAKDDWFKYLVYVVLHFSHSIHVLLSFPKKGIFKDPTVELKKKTVKQLKSMLVGVKNLSKKNKDQLIELVLVHS